MEDQRLNEIIRNIFLYNENEPLSFTALYFWVFFGVMLAGYSFIYKRNHARNAFLFVLSIFFYYKTSGFFFTILLFSTVTDYLLGFRIHAAKKQLHRKLWLAASISLNLIVLIYFKYAYFFADSFNNLIGSNWQPINYFAQAANSALGTTFRVDQILLPVGISFFTFQTMSYAIDVYRKEIEPVKNLTDFGFYVAFFPQLVAGPIVRAATFIPQLYQPYHITRYQFGMALFWIINGLIKKVVLADYIAGNFNDRVFGNPASYTGFENLMALYGYSLQVYADFSGYTDIAIGVAMLLGFYLPKNFDSPYKADNCGNFWQRWHISLSTWLKDYLYIPMGGNRKGTLFTYVSLSFLLFFVFLISGSWLFLAVVAIVLAAAIVLGQFFPTLKKAYTTNINLMMTMLLGGLWHGASWNMVLWGGLNGLGVVVYKLWRKISPWDGSQLKIKRIIGIFITFNFISFTRIWFRTGSSNTWEEMRANKSIVEEWFTANSMLNKLLYDLDFSIAPEVIVGFAGVFAVMLGGFIIHWLPESWKVIYRDRFAKAHISIQLTLTLAAIVFVYQVLSAGLQPFIYFQF